MILQECTPSSTFKARLIAPSSLPFNVQPNPSVKRLLPDGRSPRKRTRNVSRTQACHWTVWCHAVSGASRSVTYPKIVLSHVLNPLQSSARAATSLVTSFDTAQSPKRNGAISFAATVKSLATRPRTAQRKSRKLVVAVEPRVIGPSNASWRRPPCCAVTVKRKVTWLVSAISRPIRPT